MNKLIIANWKMNPVSKKEMGHLLGILKQEIDKSQEQEVVICPPFVYLAEIAKSLKKQFFLGAQDCFWEQKGAFTGEISPLMLKDLGVTYVIVGHSERRKYFKETDKIVNKKLGIVLKSRLKPILCVGEEIRDTFNAQGKPLNEMSLKVAEQLEKALINIPGARIGDIAIAYEPVWAIGTGNPCSSDDAMRATLFIRKTLTKLYNRNIADKVRIIYGGSVSSKNINDYTQEAGMDGALVGGASLNASEFVKIVDKIK